MRGKHLFVVIVLLALVSAACEPTTAPTSTTIDILPPPDPIGSTTSTSTATTTPVPQQHGVFGGFLPDETNYLVSFDVPIEDAVEGISAGIVMDVDGSPNAIGIFQFNPGDTEIPTSYEDGVYRIQAGGMVRIEFYDHILEALPPNPETAIRTGIRGTTRDDFPVLRLSEPFRWASDDELPLAMEVQYRHFVVRRGCDELAVACSPTRGLQVIPIGTQDLPLEAWNNIEVFVESSAPRPTSDPYYLDPGPLSRRLSADVVWTGEEMIVFGGKEERDGPNTLIDGAVFDPTTNTWRMLAPIPIENGTPNRAVWADGEMVVVSTEGTFGYDPGSDEWREIGQALLPPEFHDRMLYFDGSVFVWEPAFTLHRMDLEEGMWEQIPAPDESSGFVEPYAGALRSVDGRVVAAITVDSCRGRQFWQFDRDSWQPLREVSLATAENADCSSANQSAPAGDNLIIWNDLNRPTMAFSFFRNEWRELSPIPLDGTEGASGPVEMDAERFMVPRWGEGAVFDAKTEEWSHITLPGHGTDAEIIWTGTEFLAWGIWDTFDAWRGELPLGPAGGDDTR